MTEKVLVTGANGFIGRHLVKLLCARKKSVRALVRTASRTGKSTAFPTECFPVERFTGDLCDRDSLENALKGATCVYHLAGLTRERKAGEFQRINVEGTANLLDACLQNTPAPKFVYVSSLAAGGVGKKGKPKRESEPSVPISAYGKSKWAAENLLIAASDVLPISIVRPPIVFGEGDWASVDLFRVVNAFRFHLVPGWWDPLFSFVHVDDLARFLVLVAENGERLDTQSAASGRGTYYVDSGGPVRYREFGRMIGAALKLPRTRILHCPPLAVLTVGCFGELAKRLFGRTVSFDWNKAREALSGPWICSSEKGAEQLGFVPEKTLQERLDQTADWYRSEGWL